jgi:predicted DNA-binding protein YlxM (UPF0122 family)
MLTIFEIQQTLLNHQKRLQFGDDLQSITEIAKRAGVHRDTVYACLNGDRINERTQYALSSTLENIEIENQGKSKTKIMSIALRKNGVNLNFGLGTKIFN